MTSKEEKYNSKNNYSGVIQEIIVGSFQNRISSILLNLVIRKKSMVASRMKTFVITPKEQLPTRRLYVKTERLVSQKMLLGGK